MKTKYTISYVSLGVGAAALVGAVGLYFAQPREGAAATALLVAPTPGGAAASLVGRF
ncbi:MAG: hypothetical protein QM756_14655 [Polyangiaceae bacterium]